ncbi:DEAD/DEAH box helicase [Fodinibius sp.]|uniref:DEAD/DEAH box helicase n=1 Tax=Fodinibius sp. TaxID=1872440 RepID=UPI002ACD6383|nr:DEAD/DEAH box helicase [Fodinibius sp.]MDZ7659102.1 DEAD/DEAH box helicase [Fodinibius sp.]
MSFEKFNLSNELMMGLKDLRYSEPTPIQEECIPLILDGKDVIGAAQTGTGKTGAFVIPLLQKITNNKSDDTQALILSPTRELAQQIEEQIFALGYHTGITSATVTGGSDYGTQVKAIRAGVDIIVATPGRLIDQMNVLNLDFSGLKYLVLDEADRMLDMGFLPDVMKIVEQLPKGRQTMLFSATMVEEVQKVVDQVMVDPVEVEFEVSKPVDSVDQQIYFVDPNKKLSLFEQLFDADKYKTAIVFCATKRGTDEVERMLKKRGVNAVSMHGDRDQEERNEALRLFKNKTHPVMVATDVLSRGIDIDDVSLIVNFDVPNNPEDYIHRIGRTGRYDKEGTAITFVSNKDKKYYHAIKNVVGDQLTVKDISEETSPKETGREKKERSAKEEPQKQSEQQEEKKEKKKPVSREESKFAKESDKKKSDSQANKQDKEAEEPKEKADQQKPKQKKERKPRPGRSKDRSQRQKKSENGKSGNKKSSPKKNDSARSGKNISIPKHIREAEQEEDIFQPEIIEKAVSRNRKSLKPAKGIWGVIKSLFPKF